MMGFKIFLSPPHLFGNEMKYVQEAFDTNWIAPYGPSLNIFEAAMAEYLSVEKALAVNSGTAGIHLALRWLGIERGDTVFCSDLTFVGSCNPIHYQQAEPVFIDSEPDSWNMSPSALERAFAWARTNNKMPKAVIIVDLYGEPANWDVLLPICRKYCVPVIEDAAEAIGSTYKGKKCGSFGDIGIISFNGNKILTTSGGGMVVSNNTVAIEKMRFWATQARDQCLHYEHKEFGYNYRLSNISAAIGRGQLECIDEKIVLRRRIYETYRKHIHSDIAHIKPHAEHSGSNCWMNMLILDAQKLRPVDVVIRMQNAEIEARPAWKPMHMQPLFKSAAFFAHDEGNYVGESVFTSALCLPSGDGMTSEQQFMVIEALLEMIEAKDRDRVV